MQTDVLSQSSLLKKLSHGVCVYVCVIICTCECSCSPEASSPLDLEIQAVTVISLTKAEGNEPRSSVRTLRAVNLSAVLPALNAYL